MGDPDPVDHWSFGMILIPARRAGNGPMDELVVRLVAERRAKGWEFVSTATQDDGTRSLRFRRAR
jgi:hypothetical protein